MSQEPSKVLIRQWNIIQFLLDSKYVSTTDIEKYLKKKGIETTQRTIQRDLNLLETLFPLECRRDCMPFSWRWKRVEQTIKGLNLSQALILILVDEQLRDLLPENTVQEFLPLFQKAKLIISNTKYLEDESSFLDILIKDRRKGVGFVQASLMRELALTISNKVTRVYQDILNNEEKEIKKNLKKLSIVLETYEMPELVKALNI
ncbi:hypothetical protein [Acinetobacter sp. CFCC 10889]|uniref:hypothetical protein n=1 Tax=Acinetobacter sp. CFCC 10889 TaxID=1775557 RepID=UPI000DD0E522|nr:hypothetical protein [Acinetobacter sp. CFCC 10889]